MDEYELVVADFDDNMKPIYTYKMSTELILLSNTLSAMIELCVDVENKLLAPVKIIKSVRHLDLLKTYLEFMKSPGYPCDRPEDDIPVGSDLTDWEKEYMNKLDMETHYDLMQICNYLDIPRFLEPLCFWASQNPTYGIKGKTPQQLREQFGIIDNPQEDE